jgi:hypothetical protein
MTVKDRTRRAPLRSTPIVQPIARIASVVLPSDAAVS